MSRKIGILGGSFDPVHYGHLILAEQCRESAALERILFIPAFQSPLKSTATSAEAAHRAAMLRLAIAGHEPFVVDTREIERGGTSYTVDTLESLRGEYSNDQLYLILGSDLLRHFDQWRDPAGILQRARPLVVPRPGAPVDLGPLRPWAPANQWESIRQNQIQSPLIEISSSDIRKRVAEGRSIRFLTTRAVEAYIAANSLYQPETKAAE